MTYPITSWLQPTPENVAFCKLVISDISRDPLRKPVLVTDTDSGSIAVEDNSIFLKKSRLVYTATGEPLQETLMPKRE